MSARPTVMLAWSIALSGMGMPSSEGTTLLAKGDDASTPMRTKEPRLATARPARSEG